MVMRVMHARAMGVAALACVVPACACVAVAAARLSGAAHDRDAFADGVPEGDGGFNDGFVASSVWCSSANSGTRRSSSPPSWR